MNDHYDGPLSAIKNFLYIPAALAGVSLDAIGVLVALLAFDIVTGIWRSVVLSGGAAITSLRAINGFFSKFLFVSIPVTIAYMGHGMGFDLSPLVSMSMGVLTLATGYSIIGNIYTIRTGRKVKEFDAMQIILMQIQAVIERYTARSDPK